MFENLLNDIEDIAPSIFNALTGGVSGAIGSAISFLNKEFNWDSKTVNDIADKLKSMTPEEQEKLKELDIQFLKLENQRLSIENQGLKIESDDTENARDLEKTEIASGKKDPVRISYAFFIMSLFGFNFIWLFFKTIPLANEKMIYMMSGVLIREMFSLGHFLWGFFNDQNKK